MELKKHKRGFSLVELLVVVLIFLIVGGILFYLITISLKSFSKSSAVTKKEIEGMVNLNPLTFDLRHAGYGISVNETSLVISYCNGTNGTDDACALASQVSAERGKLLLLKETTNVVRSLTTAPTVAFAFWNGTNATAYPEELRSAVLSYNACVWIGTNKTYIKQDYCNNGTSPYAVTPELALGYPLDVKASCSNTNPICCHFQNCTGIAYFLGEITDEFDRCLKGTYILYRITSFYRKKRKGNLISRSIYKIPVLSCVSDWDVWFGLDTDADGNPDTWVNRIPYNSSGIAQSVLTNADLRTKLAVMKIYFLIQASYDRDHAFDYCQYATCVNDNKTIVAEILPDGHQVLLQTPQESDPYWKHYRWRVVTITLNVFPDIP